MKLVLALWSPDAPGLLGEDLRSSLAAAGAHRMQVNLDDDHIPAEVLRLQTFEQPLTCVVSVWTDAGTDPGPLVEALRPYAGEVAGWEVEERVPLEAPYVEGRTEGLAQVALLRRPADLPYADWQAHWQGPHTRVAMETQATFGYVQNRVVGAVTADAPHVDAIVEELFPSAAMGDVHAFYGSGGDQAELDHRLTRLMASVATMGADRDLDVVATSRYAWDLTGDFAL